MVYAKEKWFSLMRNEVEKKQMVWGDNKRFNPLRDNGIGRFGNAQGTRASFKFEPIDKLTPSHER